MSRRPKYKVSSIFPVFSIVENRVFGEFAVQLFLKMKWSKNKIPGKGRGVTSFSYYCYIKQIPAFMVSGLAERTNELFFL